VKGLLKAKLFEMQEYWIGLIKGNICQLSAFVNYHLPLDTNMKIKNE